MKILRIKNAPLDRVVIKTHFSEELRLDISKSGIIANKIKKLYPQEPNLVLMPILKVGETIDIPPMANLRFYDESKLNWVEIGKDYLIFVSKKYISWGDLLENILKVLVVFADVLKLNNIYDLHMTYVNKFKFNQDDFRLEDFFSLKVSKPQNWKILPHDFFIGIVPIDDDHRKIILRLKGSLESNELNYVLETVSIGKELNLLIDDEYLSEYLTETHDIVEDYFIEFLTDELHKSIGTEFR